MPQMTLTDEQAEKAGKEIALEFGLRRSRKHPDRWETSGGTFRNQGLARRAFMMIQTIMAENPEKI